MRQGLGADVVFTLGGLAFAWALVSMFLASHHARALGLTRMQSAQLLSGSRPTDPDELIVWRWMLQFCCGALVGILCVVAVVFLRR